MALLIIGSDRAGDFHEAACRQAPDRDVRLWPEVGDATEIRHALAWQPLEGELAKFPNLRLVVSVGAGVDHLFRDEALPDVPIVRYVDPDLTTRMVQYVVLHTLFHVRRMTEHLAQQREARWEYLPEPMPGEDRMVDEVVQYIPEAYNVRTTLRAELEPDDNQQDFVLESDARE